MRISAFTPVFLLVFCIGQIHSLNQKTVNDTFNQMSYEDKATFVAGFLAEHPDFFQKLLNIVVAGSDLFLGGPSPGGLGNMVSHVLDETPAFLNSKTLRYILFVIQNETHMVNTTGHMQQMLHWNLTKEQMQQNMSEYIVSHFNYYRAAERILTMTTARHLFPLSNHSRINQKCYNHSMDFIDALLGGKKNPSPFDYNYINMDWAIKMFDSFGKPSEGLSKGNLYWVGSYDLCLSLKPEIPKGIILGGQYRAETVSFGTKFCRVKFNIPDAVTAKLTKGIDTKGVSLALNWGVCVPDACRNDDVHDLLVGGLQKLKLKANPIITCLEDPDLSQDGSAIAAIVVLALFLVPVILCTIIDMWTDFFQTHCSSQAKYDLHNAYTNGGFQLEENGNVEEKDSGRAHDKGGSNDLSYLEISRFPKGEAEEKPPSKNPQKSTAPPQTLGTKLVKTFSVYSNLPKMFSAQKTPGAFHAVHGVRFFSMLWIVLGHTYNYGIVSIIDNPTTVNLIDANSFIQRFTFQGVMASQFSVDSFFVLSGLLVSYLLLKDLYKKKLSCGYMAIYFAHRFWRLTPIYMVVLMVFSTMYPYIGSGPLWPGKIPPADYCKDNWWASLLYVNNVVDTDHQCMAWTWYLADDMQFYIIAPIFVITLWLNGVAGIILCCLMMVGGVSSAFYKEYIIGGDLFMQHQIPKYWTDVYMPPWCKVAAYMVGILLGYTLHKHEKKPLSSRVAVIGWTLTWAVGLTLCYVTFDYRKEGAKPWSKIGMSFFESFGRPLWAACVAWVIYACHKGKGGIANSILSWNGFIPLSRLTYAVYLIHPIVMVVYIFNKRNLLYLNNYELAYLYIGHTIMTYMIATVFSAVFESPMIGLEKIALKSRH